MGSGPRCSPVTHNGIFAPTSSPAPRIAQRHIPRRRSRQRTPAFQPRRPAHLYSLRLAGQEASGKPYGKPSQPSSAGLYALSHRCMSMRARPDLEIALLYAAFSTLVVGGGTGTLCTARMCPVPTGSRRFLLQLGAKACRFSFEADFHHHQTQPVRYRPCRQLRLRVPTVCVPRAAPGVWRHQRTNATVRHSRTQPAVEPRLRAALPLHARQPVTGVGAHWPLKPWRSTSPTHTCGPRKSEHTF